MTEELGNSDDYTVMQKLLHIEGSFIVDAGCGDMSLSRQLAAGGASVLAIDPDPVQAESNRQLGVINNVGFAETTASDIPVEDASVDGIIFSYSMHHVPRSDYPDVFREALRILKPNGFLYALEPVAKGPLNDVMRLFHDEQLVRDHAQQALTTLARPAFKSVNTFTYHYHTEYQSFEQFADYFASRSFNSGYSEDQVRAVNVAQAFQHAAEATGYRFKCPMHVTLLRNPVVGLFDGINA